MKSKWLVLFIVFGLILTACGGGSDDAAEEVVAEEATETLDSPATTAAAAEPEATPKHLSCIRHWWSWRSII